MDLSPFTLRGAIDVSFKGVRSQATGTIPFQAKKTGTVKVSMAITDGIAH